MQEFRNNSDWDESKHPRDRDGKFRKKGLSQSELKQKYERYSLFLQEWEEMSERYNEVVDKKDICTAVNDDEVQQFFGEELIRWEYAMSDLQRQALRGYTGQNSGLINGFLRAQGKNVKDGPYRVALQQHIDLITSALADFNLEKNLLVYRVEPFMTIEKEEFELKAFTSTSTGRHLANRNIDMMQYQIEVPAGKGRGAYIQHLSNMEIEYEFLLQRNTRVKVLRQLDNGEFKIVRLRVVD